MLYLNLNSYYSYTLIGNWNAYERTFSGKGLKFEASADLVGEVWDAAGGRPAASNNEVYELEIKYSGMWCINERATDAGQLKWLNCDWSSVWINWDN